MDWSNVAAFAATEFLLCLSPGPAVLLVVGLSMRQGFWSSQSAAAGILATNIFYFALSAAGVASVILASATLFAMLKYAGAAYLAYLGVKMIAPLIASLGKKGGDDEDAALSSAARINEAPQPLLRVFAKGFGVQASNPKNLAFFVAILPQFIDPAGPVALQMGVLGTVSVLLELPILAVYALAFSSLGRIVTNKTVMWTEAAAGSVLIFLGLALAWQRRA